MNLKQLKRRPSLIHEVWVDKDDRIITKKKCTILVPYNYLEYKMVQVGRKNQVLTVCMVVVGEEYFVLNGGVWMWITPDRTRQIKTDDGEYMAFDFEAGAIVCPDTLTVKDSDLTYAMDKYFYGYGRIPCFLNYDDVGNLFTYHNEYGGLRISANNIPFEIVSSVMAHDAKDKFLFYREGSMDKRPLFVPFKSVMFNTTNTVSKLLGNYLDDGFTSALLSPTDKEEPIETILKA